MNQDLRQTSDNGQRCIINQSIIKAVSDKKLSLTALLMQFIDNPGAKKAVPEIKLL